MANMNAGKPRAKYKPTQTAITTKGLPLMLSCEQAAEVACVSRKHIRNLLASGELRGTRLGRAWRIPRDAFLEFLGL